MDFGEVWNNWTLDNLKKMSPALSDQKNQRFFGTTSPCAAVQKMGEENKFKGIGCTGCDVTSRGYSGIRLGLNVTTLWALMQ